MTNIEKCAKLMFGEFSNQMIDSGWNPLTNAQDREDLQCELGIDVEWYKEHILARYYATEIYLCEMLRLADHPTKQAALAHAVVAVAVQIYDSKFGGE